MKIPVTLLLLALSGHGLAQIYDDYLGAGHAAGIVVTASDQEFSGAASIDGAGLGHDLRDASRFLEQATLGANLGQLIYTDSIGYEAWLHEQLDVPPTSYLEVTQAIAAFLYDRWLEAGEDPEEYAINVVQFRAAWWHIVMRAPDLLRHKIALALSELLVISDQSDLSELGYGLANYYDILATHAFGNYHDLLMDIVLNPCMGFYLSHLNNPRAIPSENIHPDENFAREVMQLFTIGLYELNPDGTEKIGNDGMRIPTYDNDDIRELAKVFTGLGGGAWADPENPFPVEFGTPLFYLDATVPMQMFEQWHQQGPKTIVGGAVIPAGQSGMEDIADAVDILFNHPNVGPFVSKQLIKRLIKSNPTPEYVARIAAVFNDNGSGVRGDLKEVVRAILLDPEARDCAVIDDQANGKLREPIHRYTQLLRTFNAETEADFFLNHGYYFQMNTEQHPLSSPTVFNFFLPDYQPNSLIADAGLSAPEFQIFNSQTSIGYINMLQVWLFLDYLNELPEPLGADAMDFMAALRLDELEYIANSDAGLVDYLDLVIAGGGLSDETRDAIIDSILIIGDPEYKFRMAAYLVMMSPDYAIMK